MNCPRCHAGRQQIKAGFNRSGSQRYRCKNCGRVYTPRPNSQGYTDETRTKAVKLYLEGNSMRGVARALKVNHQTVANWINTKIEMRKRTQQPV
jgi:transposase-like protein